MIIKENTIVQVNFNGEVELSCKACFISAFSDNERHILTCYENTVDYTQFFFPSKRELEIIINTFEPLNNRSAWSGADNISSFIEFSEVFEV